jgi:hypothetical protein
MLYKFLKFNDYNNKYHFFNHNFVIKKNPPPPPPDLFRGRFNNLDFKMFNHKRQKYYSG